MPPETCAELNRMAPHIPTKEAAVLERTKRMIRSRSVGMPALRALTFAVVSQGIYFTDIDRNWSNLIIGVMLMAAVLMNNTFRQMALSFVPKKKK